MSPHKRSDEDTVQLRATLIDCARRLVERDGAPALTMRALAAEAGCAVGLPYKVFTDRHDLVAELCLAEFERLGHAFDGLAARAGTGTVGANLAWFAEILLGSPAVSLVPEVFADADLGKAVAERVRASGIGPSGFEDVFARYLELEKALRRVRVDVDVRAVAFLLAGALHNLIVSGDAWQHPSRRQLRRHLDALAATLSPETTTPAP